MKVILARGGHQSFKGIDPQSVFILFSCLFPCVKLNFKEFVMLWSPNAFIGMVSTNVCVKRDLIIHFKFLNLICCSHDASEIVNE